MNKAELHDRRSFLRQAAGALAASGTAAIASAKEGRAMPDLKGAVGWLNSVALTEKALRGKVVLVNFWTYSCINSLRELPYMKSWSAKYKEAGLLVVGVHSPEFGFERDPANVRAAVSALKIPYPIAIDSERLIWQAFRNEYWPADYIVDATGRIRYQHFGEGDYEQSERVIQRLLRENGAAGLDDATVKVVADGPEAPPGSDVRSPETYVGYARAENFGLPERMVQDSRHTYRVPPRLALNQWGLAGSWRIGAESASLESAPGKIAFRFHGRDLHMVLGPARTGTAGRFQARLNGVAPGDDCGFDTNTEGIGEVLEPRMYQLIRQKRTIADATFEIEFMDPGVKAFSFTFG